MKIAVLILAHKDAAQTERLINRLQHPSLHLFIHVDKKSPLSKHSFSSPVTQIKNNIPVFWGDFSPVQATLNGMKEISEKLGVFDYFILLSGQDYPIKPTESLLQFLQQNKGSEFIDHHPVTEDGWKAAMSRYQYFYYRKNKNVWGWAFFAVVRTFMKITGIKRKSPVPVWAGSQWFNISYAAFDYILKYTSANPELVSFMKRSNFTDELFFQTVLLNSPFKNNCVNNSLRYIHWNEASMEENKSPGIIGIKDLAVIQQSPAFFARKFDAAVDSAILNELDKITGYTS
ncbi:MAG: beta-1,6-N-acetylglucosaminyltransferase [Chitinophagaceae bacterium]